ncbi:MAG: DHH family phosphoesterase [Conexivisphaerales archaeon]
MNILITHTDLDGICSGAIAKRYVKGNVKVIFSDPRNIADTLSQLDSSAEKIIITDISLNHDKVELVLNAIMKIKSEILWVDHHEWRQEDIEAISKRCTLHVESSPSAASLFYRMYMHDDSISEEIAKIGDDADTNTNAMENTLTYKLGISQKGGKYYLLREFSHGNFEPESLKEWKVKLQEQIKVAENVVSELSVISTITGKRFAIIDMRGKPASGTYTAKLAAQNLNLDFIMVIYNCKSVSFYRGLRDVDLLPLAINHYGGGHKFACGANPHQTLLERMICWLSRSYKTKEIKQIIEDAKKI